ncbi:MAG: hypothetical protein ABW202_16825 [Duganella sp.]
MLSTLGVFSAYPYWWLALPVLLLPLWWHRQKRQRIKFEPLATARFLPAAGPEQQPVWRWRDRLLLLLRCLLLFTLIAWLAATVFPWRGDTVLVDGGADPAWVEQQIASAGLGSAQRIALPANALQWIAAHEREQQWRSNARLLIVARAGQVAMPAHLPRFQHPVELRTIPVPSSAASVLGTHRITLAAASGRADAWRVLFAAFDQAGDGSRRYTVATAPDAMTELIVWDTPEQAPPAQWRAPHWWIGAASASAWPELDKAASRTITINGIKLRYVDSARGRLWTSDALPPRDVDTARALYQAWRMLDAEPTPAYPAPAQTFDTVSAPAQPLAQQQPSRWIALALLALFLLERILTHARRP